jgi:hypothetical protein
MQCEKCGQEIETLVCVGCGKTVAKLGPFCYLCGHKHAAVQEEADQECSDSAGSVDNDVIDFSSRLLCSDGACIGVINEQGLCKVCGKPYTPEP